jgi:hypothetical protein
MASTGSRTLESTSSDAGTSAVLLAWEKAPPHLECRVPPREAARPPRSPLKGLVVGPSLRVSGMSGGPRSFAPTSRRSMMAASIPPSSSRSIPRSSWRKGGGQLGHGELFPHGSYGSDARLAHDPAPRLHPLLGGPVVAVHYELTGHVLPTRRRGGPACCAVEGR